MLLRLGTVYTEPGAFVEDNMDGLNFHPDPVGVVNMGTEGRYVLRYEATDRAGNKAHSQNRTVEVRLICDGTKLRWHNRFGWSWQAAVKA